MSVHKCFGRVTVRMQTTNSVAALLSALTEYNASPLRGTLARQDLDFMRHSQLELEFVALGSYGADLLSCAEMVKRLFERLVSTDGLIRRVHVAYTKELV